MSETKTTKLNRSERNSFRRRQCDMQRENYIFNLKMLNLNDGRLRDILIMIATTLLVFSEPPKIVAVILIMSIFCGIIQLLLNIELFSDGKDLTEKKMRVWMLAYPTEDNFKRQIKESGALELDITSTSKVPLFFQVLLITIAFLL